MLPAGVTDAATLEPPAACPPALASAGSMCGRLEMARAALVAQPVWLVTPGDAARPVVRAVPVAASMAYL